ncbi:PRD domain-containing protein [Sporosarcina sp. BI001-red]|uniref:BglG family transcription antiterminator n=1 Tax=Sporosarcina sp. BI001-red TaxID=2282866 RepID=UPI000E246BE0|nr:BglG family transcription antiterminator [Sporosarcina sp. BI001-red]REB08565.1 PRD domain-containing protein [Sporosarcina sp. BI001-red]
MLDIRRVQLVSLLADESKPIKSEILSTYMGISQRSVYYDITNINDWLDSKKLPLIETIYGEGLILPEVTKKVLQEEGVLSHKQWEYHFSSDERIAVLLVVLLTQSGAVTMKKLMDAVQMSRGTVFKDLQELKEILIDEQLTCEFEKASGYFIQGSEENKRRVLLLFLYRIKYQYKWTEKLPFLHQLSSILCIFFRSEKQEFFKKLIFKTEKELGLLMTEESSHLLLIQLLIMIDRVRDKHLVFIESDEISILQETAYYQAAEKILKVLETPFNTTFPESEISYLARQLQSFKVAHFKSMHYSSQELDDLKFVVHRMVMEFQLKACVLFDMREELERNLLAHIKPTYYRLKYNVPYSSFIVKEVQENYPDIFSFTKQVISHLEFYVRKKIPDEEVAYIALHFGGWLSREKKEISIRHRALVVCANGIGTSTMIRKQVEDLIEGLHVIAIQSLHDYEEDCDVDVIITTSSQLEHPTIPVFCVPAILTNENKANLLWEFNRLFSEENRHSLYVDSLMKTIKKHAYVHDEVGLMRSILTILEQPNLMLKEDGKPMLCDLLTNETIQFTDSVSNWKEAIRLASEPLLKNNSIELTYVDSMIQNVEELGPYIVLTKGMALPHSRPENGVQKVGMSLLRVRDAVAFSDQEKHQANLIIVLAAADNETHLTALSQLSDLLSEEENLQKLIAANSVEDVLKVIS